MKIFSSSACILHNNAKKNVTSKVVCVSCNYFLPHPQWEFSILEILLLYNPYKLNSPWTNPLRIDFTRMLRNRLLVTSCRKNMMTHPLNGTLLPYMATLLSGDSNNYLCEFQLHEYLVYQWTASACPHYKHCIPGCHTRIVATQLEALSEINATLNSSCD